MIHIMALNLQNMCDIETKSSYGNRNVQIEREILS